MLICSYTFSLSIRNCYSEYTGLFCRAVNIYKYIQYIFYIYKNTFCICTIFTIYFIELLSSSLHWWQWSLIFLVVKDKMIKLEGF